ncbi:hypothetical protein MLD38_038713 [Melastoma candidum]|uniref:Uncharacterized protein n=1 Tax=Melastoma candidum TaxID=119954 RepID=A0ACB9L0F2_9MYRT|nr:hypothetical protein MLD38_038713 [Melastoma candidum]
MYNHVNLRVKYYQIKAGSSSAPDSQSVHLTLNTQILGRSEIGTRCRKRGAFPLAGRSPRPTYDLYINTLGDSKRVKVYYSVREEMVLKRISFSRLFAKMEKINELQSGYLDTSVEITSLKARRKALKERLKQVRTELEMLKEVVDVEESARKLMKADKKTTIEGLEKILEKTRRDIAKLERSNDKTFEKREKLKDRALKGLEFVVNGEMPVVVMNRVDDVEAVAKLMELMRVNPTCKIGESVEAGSSAAIKEAASKLKVKIEGEDGPKRIGFGPSEFDEKSEIVKDDGVPAGVKEPKLKQVAPVGPFNFQTTFEPKPAIAINKKKATR